MAKKKGKIMPRYSISLTPKGVEQIEAIQEELGYASVAEAVRGCISIIYTKTFPQATRMSKANKKEKLQKVVEERKAQDEFEELSRVEQERIEQERKVEAKKTQTAQAQQIAINVCEQELNGVVGEDEDGNPTVCAYFQYDGRRRYNQEIPIEFITADLVKTQYTPNKDRVLQLQRDGHVDYDPDQHISEVLMGEDLEEDEEN